MQELAYNAVNTLVRIKESQCLTEEDFSRLLNADDFSEILEILSNTHYSHWVKKSDFIENIDVYLLEERGMEFEEFYRLSPEKEVVNLFTQRLTFHNLKLAMKSKLTGEDYSVHAVPDGRYPYEEMVQAVMGNASSSLDEGYVRAIQEVNDYLEKEGKAQGIDILFDRNYFHMQLESAKKINSVECTEEVKAYIDLMNLSILERAIMSETGLNTLRAILFEGGNFTKEELVANVGKDLEELKKWVSTSRYQSLLSSNDDSTTIWEKPFERMKDEILGTFFEKSLTVAFGPLPLLHYLHKKEMDQKNIRLIIIGKRSHLPNEEIKKRMRSCL